MIPERTELEWIYDPDDLFEAPYQHSGVDFDLLINAGRAIATLNVPQNPVLPDVEERIRVVLESILLVRQIQVHRKYSLEGPRTYQYSEGRKNISIRLGSVMEIESAGHIDFIKTDAAGNVIRDSKAERLDEHNFMMDSVVPKLVNSAILRSLFESYSRSITDPNNELVYLYEIRDALIKHLWK